MESYYIPVLALGVVVQLALDHVDHDLIADEAAGIHDLLGFPAERRLLCDLGAEHVTGSLCASAIYPQIPQFHSS